MKEALSVRVCATPRLLQDVVVRNLVAGDDIEITESIATLVSVVTPDRSDDAHSTIVIVLGDGPCADVSVLIEGRASQRRQVVAGNLRALVLELAEQVSHGPSPGNTGRTAPPPRPTAHGGPNGRH